MDGYLEALFRRRLPQRESSFGGYLRHGRMRDRGWRLYWAVGVGDGGGEVDAGDVRDCDFNGCDVWCLV